MRKRSVRDLLGDEIEKFWDEENDISCDQAPNRDKSYIVVCPYCGSRYSKLWTSILKTGTVCRSCIKSCAKSEESSLKGLYPDVAEMYDRRENRFKSTQIKPGSNLRCNFRCSNGHDFTSMINSVVLSHKNGNSGCPFCAGMAVIVGETDFQTKYPEYALYWDYESNGVSPTDVLAGSNKLYWFTCPEGHGSFTERLSSFKTQGLFCPVCHNRKVLEGYNDFKSRCPNLASYWDYEKNDKRPEEVIFGSASKFWFKCELGHSFNKSLDIIRESEGKSNGCPYCNGRQVMEGFNDLESMEPELSEMWDYDKNDVSPSEVFYRSNSYFWFICKNGHSFKKTPIDLIVSKDKRSRGCPFCASSKKIIEVDDMYYMSEEERISQYIGWVQSHITGDLSAKDFLRGYFDRPGTFVCDKGHTFTRSWNNIKRYGVGCPVCSGHVLQKGYNDFATCHPELLKYWDYEKNDVSPDDILRYSSRVVWWKCTRCGDGSFQQAVNTRVATKGLCKGCSESYSRSFAEQEIDNYIGQYVDIVTNEKIDGAEVDILIPSLNMAFEYNGLYYHSEANGKDKWYHKNKYDVCKKHGVTLYCIWEDDYLNRRDRVLSWIRNKLGVSVQEKVNARQCDLYEETEQEAADFLERNHIQGHSPLSRYISLRVPGSDGTLGEIVALMAYAESSDGFIQIRRYATSANVRGGFTKILSWLENNGCFYGAITFSDNAVSTGALYSNSGFERVSDVDPDYSYIVRDSRIHKFNYRKDRFKKDPELQFVEGMSEKELADLNGLVRVWDYGKVKWIKYFSK